MHTLAKSEFLTKDEKQRQKRRRRRKRTTVKKITNRIASILNEETARKAEEPFKRVYGVNAKVSDSPHQTDAL